MTVIQYIRDLDRRFAWSFLGVLLALLFGTITIYREFIEDKRPSLQYDVLTSTSVLDVKEQVSNLSVLFDGIDVRKQGLSLRVVGVRVLNDSTKDILKGYYDDKAPLGINISTGRIIKAELIDASNQYLRDNVTLDPDGDKAVLFPSVIIEAEQSFTFKLLVLHPQQETPTLKVVGKVAGIPSIPIREAYRDSNKVPFLKATFQGGFFAQALRLLAYTIGTIILLVVIIAPIVIISSKLDKGKRKKAVKQFKAVTNLELNESDEFIFTQYIEHGDALLLSMQQLISDPDNLAKAYARYQEHKKREDYPRVRPPLDRYEQDYVFGIWFYSQRIEDYLDAGIIRKKDDGLIVDDHLSTTLDHFIRFLRNKRLLSKKEDFLRTNRKLAEDKPSTPDSQDEKAESGKGEFSSPPPHTT